jgi:hypothetical protein
MVFTLAIANPFTVLTLALASPMMVLIEEEERTNVPSLVNVCMV